MRRSNQRHKVVALTKLHFSSSNSILTVRTSLAPCTTNIIAPRKFSDGDLLLCLLFSSYVCTLCIHTHTWRRLAKTGNKWEQGRARQTQQGSYVYLSTPSRFAAAIFDASCLFVCIFFHQRGEDQFIWIGFCCSFARCIPVLSCVPSSCSNKETGGHSLSCFFSSSPVDPLWKKPFLLVNPPLVPDVPHILLSWDYF